MGGYIVSEPCPPLQCLVDVALPLSCRARRERWEGSTECSTDVVGTSLRSRVSSARPCSSSSPTCPSLSPSVRYSVNSDGDSQFYCDYSDDSAVRCKVCMLYSACSLMIGTCAWETVHRNTPLKLNILTFSIRGVLLSFLQF